MTGKAVRGGNQEMSAAASRVEDLDLQNGLGRLVGLLALDAVRDDRFQGRIQETLD